MSNCDGSRSDDKAKTENRLDYEMFEKTIVEAINVESPNALKEKAESAKLDQPMAVDPVPNSVKVERALKQNDFLAQYEKDMKNLEHSADGKASSGMESGIFSNTPRSNIMDDDNTLYYFKHMVPSTNPTREPLSDLLKDMILQATKQTGFYAPNMFRKVPYTKTDSPFEIARGNMAKYINQKVTNGTEVWKPKLSGLVSQFGSKFNSRFMVPKVASFMTSRFGRFLMRFMRK